MTCSVFRWPALVQTERLWAMYRHFFISVQRCWTRSEVYMRSPKQKNMFDSTKRAVYRQAKRRGLFPQKRIGALIPSHTNRPARLLSYVDRQQIVILLNTALDSDKWNHLSQLEQGQVNINKLRTTFTSTPFGDCTWNPQAEKAWLHR